MDLEVAAMPVLLRCWAFWSAVGTLGEDAVVMPGVIACGNSAAY